MKKITVIFLAAYLISTVIFTVRSAPCKPEKQPSLISVYRTSSGTVSIIPMEKYVMGVVEAEMPSSFHMEALKAQAVASRTYAAAKSYRTSYSKAHPLAPVCDSTHCQVYSDEPVSQKIKEAVKSTDSQLIYYNGQLIESALYHSSSGGRTENSEDVFVSSLPYLRSVESPYEETLNRSGHGVGMSQHGANGMAENGYDYKKILSHYYSGTVVR